MPANIARIEEPERNSNIFDIGCPWNIRCPDIEPEMFIPKQKTFHWTYHARAKMNFYKLSEQRVRRVIHSPKRTEVGVAPKTVAVMQPVSLKTKVMNETAPSAAGRSRGAPLQSGILRNNREETWNQEIWVMYQEAKQIANGKSQIVTKIISAWRYPGRSKPKSEAVIEGIKTAYNEYMRSHEK